MTSCPWTSARMHARERGFMAYPKVTVVGAGQVGATAAGTALLTRSQTW